MRLISTIIILLSSLVAVNAQKRAKMEAAGGKGIASYYHPKFEGRKTATGEVFKNEKFTAASNNLRLGTYIKVTNLKNKQVVYVKVNDRMAPTNKRIVDLTSTAAEQLNFKDQGVTQVSIEVVTEEEGRNGILAQREILNAARPANTL
jgi:rare lipoprotein A